MRAGNLSTFGVAAALLFLALANIAGAQTALTFANADPVVQALYNTNTQWFTWNSSHVVMSYPLPNMNFLNSLFKPGYTFTQGNPANAYANPAGWPNPVMTPSVSVMNGAPAGTAAFNNYPIYPGSKWQDLTLVDFSFDEWGGGFVAPFIYYYIGWVNNNSFPVNVTMYTANPALPKDAYGNYTTPVVNPSVNAQFTLVPTNSRPQFGSGARNALSWSGAMTTTPQNVQTIMPGQLIYEIVGGVVGNPMCIILNEAPVNIQTVSILPVSQTVNMGSAVTFTANAVDQNNNPISVTANGGYTWTNPSSGTMVTSGTDSSTETVTFNTVGSYTIGVASPGNPSGTPAYAASTKTATATVTVIQPAASGHQVTISATALPKQSYKAWFQRSIPTKIGVTVP